MQQQFTAIEIIRHSGNWHNKSCTTYILTPSHMIIIRFNVRLFYVTSSRKSSHNNYKSSQQLQEFTTITSISNNPEHQMHTYFQGVMAQLNLTLFTSPPTLQSTVYPMLTTIIQWSSTKKTTLGTNKKWSLIDDVGLNNTTLEYNEIRWFGLLTG